MFSCSLSPSLCAADDASDASEVGGDDEDEEGEDWDTLEKKARESE